MKNYGNLCQAIQSSIIIIVRIDNNYYLLR